MGTHGRTGLRWLLAGSVALVVLRVAHCPVLAVRSAEDDHASKPIQVILHPTDFSVHSEAALRVARVLARDHGAKLIILHVAMVEFLANGAPGAGFDPPTTTPWKTYERTTDGPDLKFPVTSILRLGYIPDEIMQVAEENHCDLIVMGTHGRTGLGRLLMGTVTENVLPRSSSPVLVVKAGQAVPARPGGQLATGALTAH